MKSEHVKPVLTSCRQLTKMRRALLASGLTVAGTLVFQPVLAQQKAQGLEEIVVTSRKVSEKLQDIPLTVTAYSAKALEENKVIKLTDLNALTPGMNFQDATGRGGPGRFFVRGLTGGVAGTTRASTFLDGVFIANSAANVLFGEMERVEVLLGPQSTQYGRSTFGGALNYITKRPTNTFKGDIKVSAATQGEKTVDAWIGGPLIPDVLLGSLYFGYQKYGAPDKWRNPPDILHPDGVRLGGTETKMISGKLVFNVTDNFQLTGRVSYTKDHDDPVSVVLMLPSDRTAAYAQTRVSCTSALASSCTFAAPAPAYYFSGVLSNHTAFQSGFPYAALNLDQSPDPTYHNNTQRNTVVGDWTLPNEAVVKTTLSMNREETPIGQFADSDFSDFPSSRFTPNHTTVKDNSLEVRLDSNQKQSLRYSAGVYYLDVKNTLRGNPNGSYGDFVCTTICVPTSPAALFNTAVAVPGTTPTGFTGSVTGTSTQGRTASKFDTNTGVRDKSIFGGVFYDFTNKLTASVEVRYQDELVTNVNISNPAAPIGGTVEFYAVLPRLNIQYKFTPDFNVYGVISRGNNPGGLNTAVQLGRPGTGTSLSQRLIKEEILDNYEAGFKSMWLNNTLRINAAVYHMIWKNLQNTATYFDPASTFFGVTENRGKAKIDGLDLEAEYAASKNLTLRGTFSVNNSRYVDLCSVQLANLLYGPASTSPLVGADASCVTRFNQRGVSVAGKHLETSPAKTGSFTVDYHTMVMDNWRWNVHAGVQYQDGQYADETNLVKTPSSITYAVSTGLEKGGWSFSVGCRNCSNDDQLLRFTRLTDPRASNAPVASGGLGYNQSVGGSPRRPRQWGADVGYKF